MSVVQGGSAVAPDADPEVVAALIAGRLDARRLEVWQSPVEDGCGMLVLSPEMRCELAVRPDGISAEWAPLPRPGYGAHPELSVHVASGIAAILNAAKEVPPAVSGLRNYPLATAAGLALRRAGLKVTLDPHIESASLDVVIAVTVSNRRSPDAGTVNLNEDGSLVWDWPFPPGTSQEDIAARAAATIHSLLPAPQLAA